MPQVNSQFMMIPSRRAFLELACATGSLPAWIGCAQRRSVRRVDDTWFRERLAEDTERSLQTVVQPNGYLGRIGAQPPRQGVRPFFFPAVWESDILIKVVL